MKFLKYKRIYILGLIPISLALTLVAKQNKYFAEQIFALHIYKWISQIISTISGIFPFSLAEILLYVFPILIIFLVIRFFIKLIKYKVNRKVIFFKGVLNLFCFGSIMLFLFTVFAGLNYYRYPFSDYSNLEIAYSSVEELYFLTESLALQANDLRDKTIKTDENNVFQLSTSMHDLGKMAVTAMELLSEEYPVLGGNYGSPKPILLSSVMSRTEITGIFIPFTMEANVNVDIPDYSIPATMLHELAHLRGFMREDEANYIAYLAGMASDNPEISYSSTMLALVVSGNALYERNKDLYFSIRDQYSEGVLIDIRANSAYWQQYDDTVISALSDKVNDTYLKANAQIDGVQSYGRMLDLLLAKYRNDKLAAN